MTRRRRRLPMLVGIVVVALLAPAVAAAASRAVPARADRTADEVVVVAVPGLQWQDVRSGEMPALAALARRAATGLLSVKVIDRVTRCGDGLLAISAGSRTRGGARACTWDPAAWSGLRAANLHSSYRAHVGALGDALRRAGIPTAAVGPDALPLLADAAGRVGSTATDVATALRRARAVAVVAPQIYDARGPGALRRARAAIDATVSSAVRAAGRRALLLVLGSADPASGGSHLHVAVAAGPGFAVGRLVSSSTGRAPYVQLIDVAPTVLAALGVAAPSTLIGTPMRSTGRGGPVSAFVDADRHAVRAAGLSHPTASAVIVVDLALMLLFVLAGPRDRMGVAPLRLLALAAMALPVATFLPQLAPWWRAAPSAYVGLVVLGAVVVTAAAALWRDPRRAAAAALAATAGVLAVDQLAGAPLQLAAPLGDSPLVAGRFHGMGNVAFGLFASSALLLAALLAARRPSRGSAASVAAAIGAAAVVVDGAPFLGDDLGGLLALLPAVGVLVILMSGLRVTRRRVLALGGAGLAVALTLALADYSRPPDRQTHMGRFVGSLLHGGAGVVLHRKLDSNVHQLVHSAFTLFLLGVAGFAFAARAPLRREIREVPGLAAGLWAVAVVAVVGGLANDSGVAIPAMTAAVAVPLMVVLAAPRHASTTMPPSAPPASSAPPGQLPMLRGDRGPGDPAATRG